MADSNTLASFDVNHAIIREKPAWEPLQITQIKTLKEALANSEIASDVPLIWSITEASRSG